jgi:F-type H+-transporting ATPase subunit b
LNLRFRTGIFAGVLLAALVLGLSAAPSRAVAQSTAPAAQAASAPATTAQAGQAAQPEAAKEEGENVFRHSTLVKWAAKTLNLEVETTARLFEIINFAIIVLGIGIPLYRVLPKILRKRKATLSENIESARKATAEANARLSAIEAQLSGLDAEIAKIRSQVEQESLQDEARIKATIEEESARIVVAAEQEISSAAAQATRALRHFAADLAIDQAAAQLKFTPEIDRALIAEFAGDIGKGGKS